METEPKISKIPSPSTTSEEEETASFVIVDDETSSELSKLLDLYHESPPPLKVTFIDDPYASSVIFQSSAAYVTINGNEETCGSSFSDSECSVMASVHFGSCARRFVSGAWELESFEARDWGRRVVGDFVDVDVDWDGFFVDGCDYGDELLEDLFG